MLDDRDPGRQGKAVPGLARGAGRICRRECVGRRLGADDGLTRVPGAGHLQSRVRRVCGAARRPGHTGGAAALWAPGLPDLEAVRAVCAAVGKPFNFMVGIKGKSFTVAALAASGVKRISLATSLYRAAMTGLLIAAKEVRDQGTFGYLDSSLASPEMNAFLRD